MFFVVFMPPFLVHETINYVKQKPEIRKIKMTEIIEFNLNFKTINGIFLTYSEGTKVECFMKELSGEQRDAHNNFLMLSKSKQDGDKIKIVDYTGITQDLVSRCLFRASDNTPFTSQELTKFPANVLMKLGQMATELNGLSEKAEEVVEKNL